MDLNDPHYIDVLRALNKQEVRHILVGGLAVGYHGYDQREIHGIISQRPFDHPTPIRVISESGKKVDLMTTVYKANFSFEECLEASHKHKEMGTLVNVIHINQLIYLKERTNRYDKDMQDLVDAQKLKEIRNKKLANTPKKSSKGKDKGMSM